MKALDDINANFNRINEIQMAPEFGIPWLIVRKEDNTITVNFVRCPGYIQILYKK